MDMSVIRDKNISALNEELTSLLKAQFNLRMQKATQQLQNSSQLKKSVGILREHALCLERK